MPVLATTDDGSCTLCAEAPTPVRQRSRARQARGARPPGELLSQPRANNATDMAKRVLPRYNVLLVVNTDNGGSWERGRHLVDATCPGTCNHCFSRRRRLE